MSEENTALQPGRKFAHKLRIISVQQMHGRQEHPRSDRNIQEEENHITSGSCKVYGDLTSQFGDLKEDSNLVDFFNAVLDRRDNLEDEDRKQQSLNAVVDARSSPSDRTRLSRPRDLHPTGPLQH